MKKIVTKFKNFIILISEKFLFVQTFVILSIVYVFVLGPVWFMAKITGKDFLRLSKYQGKSFWLPRKNKKFTLQDARKQF